MTYGRWCQSGMRARSPENAVVSHLAELVRGYFYSRGRAPHPPFGHLLPKGRRNTTNKPIILKRPAQVREKASIGSYRAMMQEHETWHP